MILLNKVMDNIYFMNEEEVGKFALSIIENSYAKNSIALNGSSYPIYQNPSKWSWRDVRGWDWTTPIRSQKGHECRYVAIYDVLESCFRIWSKIYRDTQHVRIDEIKAEGAIAKITSSGKDDFGGLEDIAKFICEEGVPLSNIEIPTLKNYLFENGLLRTSVKKTMESEKFFIPSCFNHVEDTAMIKEWIHRYGPVVTNIRLSPSFTNYEEGVITSLEGGTANHAVSIFGYNDEKGYWLCKNSWGTDWGEDGWFRVKYNSEEIKSYGFGDKGFLVFSPPPECMSPKMFISQPGDKNDRSIKGFQRKR